MRTESSRQKAHNLDDLLRVQGLVRVPFCADDKMESLYPSSSQNEATVQLDTTAALRGVMVLTGSPGTGKSTLVKTWMRGLEPKRFLPQLISQASLSAAGVLEILLAKLGDRPRFKRSTNLLALEKRLCDIEPQTCVLVLDDAQNYPPAALEELRMLLGLGGKVRSAFALVLLGDEYLLGSLRLSVQRSLFSRISSAYQIHPLAREDIAPYLNWHVSRAGLNREIFAEAAVDMLAEASAGNPRTLNLLAQAAWLHSARAGLADINASHVHAALRQVPTGNLEIASN